MSEETIGFISKSRSQPSLGWIILAASSGSLIEWYDFYIYSTMAVFIGDNFFSASKHNPMISILLSMATLGIGFAIRPIGGLFFGSLGDRIGRKYTFLMTLILIGVTTTSMGLLPTFQKVGYIAPVILILLRLLQGLAMGGDAGASTVYVAEQSPERRRGLNCGILIAMSPVGTILAVGVVYLSRNAMDATTFSAWGWRVPFLVSGVLVFASLYLRARLNETPVFRALIQHHQSAKSPARELFFNRENFIKFLLTIFGSSAGQSAMGITALVYALSFMQAVLKVDISTASAIFFIGIALATPFYALFGLISDYTGRRPMIILGAVCAIVFYIPIYAAMKWAAAPLNFWMLVFLIWLQVFFLAIIIGPNLAFMVEIFPARVRTTGTSVALNVSNGLLNGFSVLIAFSLIVWTKNIYSGLAYPILLLIITVVVNLIFVKETYRINIHSEKELLTP
jgi:MFS family permease